MLIKILLGVLVVLVLVFGLVVAQPDDYRVVRSATIAAAPEAVFAHVNDFHKWDAWSPWAKLDPSMKVSYSGPDSGQGAVYDWTGNSDVGQGRMTILESQPGQQVRIQLDFIQPFASTADNTFVFKPDSGGTRVDWIMSGKNDLMSKAMCLFMGGMDKMVGPDFEKGLAQLKRVSEPPR